MQLLILIKRTAHRQDFGAKLYLTNHNGAPVATSLSEKIELYPSLDLPVLNVKTAIRIFRCH